MLLAKTCTMLASCSFCKQRIPRGPSLQGWGQGCSWSLGGQRLNKPCALSQLEAPCTHCLFSKSLSVWIPPYLTCLGSPVLLWLHIFLLFSGSSLFVSCLTAYLFILHGELPSLPNLLTTAQPSSSFFLYISTYFSNLSAPFHITGLALALIIYCWTVTIFAS